MGDGGQPGFPFQTLLTCRRGKSGSEASEKDVSCSRATTRILISPSHLLVKSFIKEPLSLTAVAANSKSPKL